MVVCLYAHVGNFASEEGKSRESIRRGEFCENPTILGAVGPSKWKNPVKTQYSWSSRPKKVENIGNVASEGGTLVKTQGCLVQWGRNVENQEILHQKRENPVKTKDSWCNELWKHVGHAASEEGKSCENPRIFGNYR